MEYSVNVAELYKAAFGVGNVNNYSTTNEEKSAQLSAYPLAKALDIDNSDVYSVLGTPVIMPLLVPDFNYEVIDNRGKKQIKKHTHFSFSPTTLIDVSMQKNIVITSVQGRSGTIKELVSNGDYVVRIRGLLVGKGNTYPKEQLQNLVELVNLPVSFPVQNDFMTWLGVYRLVVQSFDFPSLEGFANVQPFVLNCLSDQVYDIQISENATKYRDLL